MLIDDGNALWELSLTSTCSTPAGESKHDVYIGVVSAVFRHRAAYLFYLARVVSPRPPGNSRRQTARLSEAWARSVGSADAHDVLYTRPFTSFG